MSLFELTSGEWGNIEIIPRREAIDILSKPAPRRTWFGQKYRLPYRVSRGPGPAVDLLNYALQVNGKYRAIIRIGKAPWANRPAIAAVGPELAAKAAYLARLWAAGISSEDLVEFIKQVNLSFPHEIRRRHPTRSPFHYLLSLDSMAGWLIESPYGSIFESPPLAGRIYHRAGALYAGQTQSAKPSRYMTEDGQVRSLYNDGRTLTSQLQQQGARLIDDGRKHRFVFIAGAAPGSLEYVAYRAVLPPWVGEYEWGEQGLGWIQPRLLVKPLQKLLTGVSPSIEMTLMRWLGRLANLRI
jgi:hypothetical protein